MKFAARPRVLSLLRLSCVALALPMLSAQSAPPEQRITFPYKDVSDLRGLLNVVTAFQRACLERPVTQDLPERLVPKGYQVVSSAFHIFGEEQGVASRQSILSKTGREESDFSGGHPIIELTMPRNGLPDGDCRVVWKRAWDYPDHVDDIMFNMAVLFDARVSYYLKAIRVSRPDDVFAVAKRYGILSEWVTPCWNDNPCRFTVLGSLDPETGIDLTISRD